MNADWKQRVLSALICVYLRLEMGFSAWAGYVQWNSFSAVCSSVGSGIIIVLRTISNFGMSFLLAVTLLWGGCLSCSQYFMFPNAKAGCCKPASGCGKVPA